MLQQGTNEAGEHERALFIRAGVQPGGGAASYITVHKQYIVAAVGWKSYYSSCEDFHVFT